MENKFDRDIRDQMNHHPSEMDLDKFWNDLEPKLPKKKNRKLLIGWIWLSGLIGTLVILFMLDQKLRPDRAQSEMESKSLPENRIDERTQEQGDKGTLDISEANPESSYIKADKNHSSLLASEPKSIDPTAMLKDQGITDSDILNPNEVSNIQLPLSAGSKPTANFKQTPKFGSDVTSIAVTPDSGKELPGETMPNSQNQVSEEIGKFPNRDSDGKSVFDVSMLNSEHSEQMNVRENQAYLPGDSNQVKVLPFYTDTISVKGDPDTSVKVDPDLGPVSSGAEGKSLQKNGVLSQSNKAFQFYIRPELGVGWYDRKLKVVNDSFSNYLNMRENSESKLEEWCGSMLFGLSYRRLNLEAGFQYLLRNEKFEFVQKRSNYYFGTTLADVEYANGNRDSVTTLGWYGNQYSRRVVHYNTIQQLNIPLTVGVDVWSMKEFAMGIRAGLLFSVWNQMSGRILNDRMEISDFESLEISKVRKNLGLGWNAGIYSSYHLNDRYTLTGVVQYHTFHRSYLKGPIEQQYRSFYFGLGLQIRCY